MEYMLKYMQFSTEKKTGNLTLTQCNKLGKSDNLLACYRFIYIKFIDLKFKFWTMIKNVNFFNSQKNYWVFSFIAIEDSIHPMEFESCKWGNRLSGKCFDKFCLPLPARNNWKQLPFHQFCCSIWRLDELANAQK